MVFLTLRAFVLLGLVGGMIGGSRAAQYGLVKDYSGPSFFDGWNFYDHCAFFFSFLFFSSY